MIGKLRGLVDEVLEDSVILDVNGVGYQVLCSKRTLAAMPAVGEAAQLIIEMHVREDHIHMFGFPDTIERNWFRLLASVQRVGNKMALLILGTYTAEQLMHAIIAKDTMAFSSISGVGPKLAERIVSELKDKALKLPTSSFQPTTTEAPTPAKGATKSKKKAAKTSEPSHTDDVISALVNLGYSRSEAYTAALKASQDSKASASLDEIIKLSLKELVKG